ncbi:hypothetical protein FIBSPDRAFT_844783 [Athelia psychrophila]|uniref:Uncharacterized protein n=1 Tax=Athelia psychrophila TaxID=1759441 RepID=A0A167U5Z0_9AGAM|nr:hypothetical protein FIBSPDRAFT_844783 [Fibularhizoctonia sp. CBS 109695]
MGLNNEATAALIYLVLYTIIFVSLILGYITRRLKLRSRYSVLTFHVTVRLAAQATGLAFGIIGFSNPNLLIAYFVLGAEGYFTLVLSTFRFLISWQNHNTPTHDSWLEPPKSRNVPLLQRPMSVIHYLLIAANAIIVAGGALLAGGDAQKFQQELPTSKGMRVTGQAVFFIINIFLLYCILRAIRQSIGGRTHPTLLLLLAAWPLLFVRGMYGMLSGVLPAFNYFDVSNYTATGLTNSFVASEYVLGTTMEWASCVLILSTWYTSRNDPKKADFQMMDFEAGTESATRGSYARVAR